MQAQNKNQKIHSAMESIDKFKRQANPSTLSPQKPHWKLDIPLWQLALEGIAAFAIAFICGQGLGVFVQFISGE